MKRFTTIILLILTILLAYCANNDTAKIEDAVNSQMSFYPEARLLDLYKAFFQAEFGPEHIIADTASAGRYLDSELLIPDNSDIMYEPIGADSAFFRVHLWAVQSGRISRNELFDAFISGARKVESDEISKWAEKWHKIESVIESMNLQLTGYEADRAAIDSLLNAGQYALHHSQQFRDKYDPHYRIVRKDLFYERLFEALK
jgi:hypothetical protein